MKHEVYAVVSLVEHEASHFTFYKDKYLPGQKGLPPRQVQPAEHGAWHGETKIRRR